MLSALDALPEPPAAAPGVMLPGAGGALVSAGANFAESLAVARATAERARTLAGATFWWTEGGAGVERLAFASFGMPDASAFAGMVTGRFEPSPQTQRR